MYVPASEPSALTITHPAVTAWSPPDVDAVMSTDLALLGRVLSYALVGWAKENQIARQGTPGIQRGST